MDTQTVLEYFKVGTEVYYYAFPFTGGKPMGIKTHVISSPQYDNGKHYVLVAGIGDWVNIENLDKIEK